MFDYSKYIDEITTDIKSCIEYMGYQPVLFVGAGLSIRYANCPNWEGLLSLLVNMCPKVPKEFPFYKQKYPNPIDIGSFLSRKFNDWAWSQGKGEFPYELFESKNPPDIYLKYKISELLRMKFIDNGFLLHKEVSKLQSIRPHAIITTNYDPMIEKIFPDYTAIVGQQILRPEKANIGEIFKIHGCISNPNSIVITKDDYDTFISKKKYLSAKLLTFFVEHPLLFIGYSAEDPNIRAILSDIDEILSDQGGLIENIYILEWSPYGNPTSQPVKEKVIPIDNGKPIRVKSIVAHDFGWVYDAFSTNSAIANIDRKHLRALLSRAYELVRSESAKNNSTIDYKLISLISNDDPEIMKFYGITNADGVNRFNENFPYCISEVAAILGYNYWHGVKKLMDEVKAQKGIDIQATNNIYHSAVIHKGFPRDHKYSSLFVDLMKKVKNKEHYDVEI